VRKFAAYGRQTSRSKSHYRFDPATVIKVRSPADLTDIPQPCRPVPTFAEYVPIVSAGVSTGTRRAYGSSWNRVLEHWGSRRLDEPTPSEIRQLMVYVKTHVVARRNARGGRSAEEHLVAALRCRYQRAVEDGLIAAADNPARKVAKPRRLPSTRRAMPGTRLPGIRLNVVGII
jgi:integrase/recombinase XerC